LTPDSMQVRLHLRLIRVLAVLVDTLDELVVAVASTRSWSRCPHCGFRCRSVHDTRLRRVRDLPVSGVRPFLLALEGWPPDSRGDLPLMLGQAAGCPTPHRNRLM
jgi:hypothetical protein